MVIKNVLKRTLALFLVAIMMFLLLPLSLINPIKASAAKNDTKTVDGLTVTQIDGDGSFTFDGKLLSISETSGSTSGGCGGTSYTQYTTKVTVKNDTDADVKLTFDGKLTNGGSATINGDSFVSGTSINLAPDLYVEISVTSHKSNTNVTTLDLEIVRSQADQVKTTFLVSENGSYTVDGEDITAETEKNNSAAKTYKLVATPASGYSFFGWLSKTTDAETYVSYTATYETKFDAPTTIQPVFVKSETAIFAVGSDEFFDLGDAVTAAEKASKKVIVLKNDGTLAAGDYTIPSGVTLLIPYDSNNTASGSDPVTEKRPTGTVAVPKPFRTLTLADDVNITVHGSIEVAAKHYASHGGTFDGGTPIDTYGYIIMQGSSKIELQKGAKLYAWGYITGSETAEVIAYSGSTVYEKMQVADYRGGSATVDLADEGFFPFSQYYVQNVEVKETIHHGAQLICHAGVYATLVNEMPLNFMGEDSMFTIEEGAYATKYYDKDTDRLIIDVSGDFSFNPISITFQYIYKYNTADFALPINQNITININSGTTTCNQDLMLQPGCIINIDEDATVRMASGKKLYLLDADDWGTYCFGAKLRPVSYVPTKGGAPGIRTENNMTDAELNINGTIILDGAIFATSNHASVVSKNKTGVIKFNSNVIANTSIRQCTSNETSGMVDVAMFPIVLTNSDGTTVNTSGTTAGTNYYYNTDCNMWVTHGGEEHDHNCVVTLAPTCTTSGVNTHICVCGDTYTEDVPALGHNYTGTIKNNGDGTHSYACTNNCGEYGKTAKHTYTEEITTAPTCTVAGLKTFTCTCGDTYTEDVLALGHTPVTDAAVAPGCTSTGLTEGSHCSRCGEVLVAQEVVDELGHNYAADVTAPTCTDKGYTTHTCSGCDDSYVDSWTEALGHHFEGGKCTVCDVAGDIDNNGELSIADCVALRKYLLDGTELTEEELEVADFNGDGEISIADCVAMRAYLLAHTL